MRRRYKLLAVLVGVPMVLAAAAAIVAPRLVDSEHYKGEVVALVKEQTGHDLRIGGNVRLHVFPGLSLTVSDIEVANPPGFGKGSLARLPWLKVDVDVLALLGGRVEPRALVATGLVVRLESDEDGRGNWELQTDRSEDGGASSGGPSMAALAPLAVGGLDIRDVAIHWRGPTGESFEVSGVELRTGRLRGGEGIEDVHLRATFPESGVVIDARGDVAAIRDGGVLAVPELAVSLLAPDLGGRRAEGKLEAGASVNLREQRLFLSDVRAYASGSVAGDEFVRVQVEGDLAIDTAGWRLTESKLAVGVPRYNLGGREIDLAVEGVLSGDLQVGEFTFHGMQGAGNVAGRSDDDPRIPFTLAGSLEADTDGRKLIATDLAIAGGDAGLPFAFGGDLEFTANVGTLAITDMDLRLDDWTIAGDATLRSARSPTGVQGALDVRLQGQPVAGSFAVLPSTRHTDAMAVRADMVANLDIETDAIALRGPSAVVLRAEVKPGGRDRPWRIGDLEMGARLKDAALPGGELTVKLGADVDVDPGNESVATDNLRVTVGESHIAGSVRVSGLDEPAIRVDLQADAVDADRLRLPVAAPVAGSKGPRPTKNAIEAIRALDFTGEVRIERLTVNGVMMENVRLTSGGGASGG